jgi:hypothetical protein
MGAKGTATAAGAALGKKLDLAAVDATAGGKEGTVIWAKRAEGRVARTSCSAAGAGLAGLDSTGDCTDSTVVTLMFFVLGVWAGGAAVATLGVADDRVGLDGAAALVDAGRGTAAVLSFTAFGSTAGLAVGLALAAGFTEGFTAGLATTLTAGFAAVLAAGFTAALAAGFTAALAEGFAAALAVITLAGLVVFEAAADFTGVFVLFGVFTSCLLAVSKGRLLTVCPCAADPKPVHMLLKPLL